MHPNKREGVVGHNAKLKRMTENYGDADPAMKKLAPDTADKKEGPEDVPEFGADSAAPKARSDRPARRTAAANPVATYAKGGVVARAHGGRTKKGKGATHVNVIVSPHGAQPAPTPPPVIPKYEKGGRE